MPRTHEIKATEMFEPVEVSLWDESRFRLREATRTVETKVEDKQQEINDLSKKTAPLEKEITELQRQITELWESNPGSPKISALEDEIQEKREQAKKEESTMEDALPYLIEMLDILLEPLTPKLDPETGEQVMVPAETTKDGKPKAGTEMVPAFITAEESIKLSLEEDKIGISHIDALSKKLNEVAMEARPS